MYHGFIVFTSLEQTEKDEGKLFARRKKFKFTTEKIKAQKISAGEFFLNLSFETPKPTHHYHQELTLRLTHSTWVWLHLMIIRCPNANFQGLFFSTLKVDRGWSARVSVSPSHSTTILKTRAWLCLVKSKNGIMNDKQSQPPWVSEPLIRYIGVGAWKMADEWSSTFTGVDWLNTENFITDFYTRTCHNWIWFSSVKIHEQEPSAKRQRIRSNTTPYLRSHRNLAGEQQSEASRGSWRHRWHFDWFRSRQSRR